MQREGQQYCFGSIESPRSPALDVAVAVSVTITILNEYAIPKVVDYYSSKRQPCICSDPESLAQLMQCFVDHNIAISSIYDGSLSRSRFVAMVLPYFDENAASGIYHEPGTAPWTCAVTAFATKLYTILELYQHVFVSNESYLDTAFSSQNYSSCDERSPAVSLSIPTTSLRSTNSDSEITARQQRKQKKHQARMDRVVKELSRSTSQRLCLQETNDILKEVADEAQRELAVTQQKQSDYVKQVQSLQSTHHAIETQMQQLQKENDKLRMMVGSINKRVAKIPVAPVLVSDYPMPTQETTSLSTLRQLIDVHPVCITATRATVTKKERRLKVLDDEDIANLSLFYMEQKLDCPSSKKKNRKNGKTGKKKADAAKKKKEKQLNVWQQLWEGISCVPSMS